MAYLISLEFLYRLFEQLSILYSDGAERQVPLEYLRKHLHTEFNKNLIDGVGLVFYLFIFLIFRLGMKTKGNAENYNKIKTATPGTVLK